jgi:membrane protein
VTAFVDRLPTPLRYLAWALKDFGKDNGPQWAAALTYYALLSIFPLMLAALSIASHFVDVGWVADQATVLLRQFVPTGENELRGIIYGVYQARGGATAISIALLLWTGSQVFGVATQALNIAFNADETFGFVQRILVQFTMAVTIGALILVALLSRTVIDFVWRAWGFNETLPAVGAALQWLVPGALLVIALHLAYRWVPRCEVHGRPAWIGALVATVVFLAARPIFGFYVSRFANYNLVYGSLAILIVLVFWSWVTAQIFLYGGQLASLIEAMEHQGKDRDEVVEQHEKRAPVRKLHAQGESSE